MAHYLAFIFTTLLAVAIPGPDFLLVFQTSLKAGKREGVYSALGIASGLIVHGTFASIGLSAVLLKSAKAFEIIKWAGAIYLLYLAAQLIVDLLKHKNSQPLEELSVTTSHSAKKHIMRGFFTNVLNIKVALFFMAIVPQFVVGDKNVTMQIVIFSVLQILISLAWFILLAISVNKLGRFLKQRKVQRSLDGTSAAIFIGLAAKLATTHRN